MKLIASDVFICWKSFLKQEELIERKAIKVAEDHRSRIW